MWPQASPYPPTPTQSGLEACGSAVGRRLEQEGVLELLAGGGGWGLRWGQRWPPGGGPSACGLAREAPRTHLGRVGGSRAAGEGFGVVPGSILGVPGAHFGASGS